MILKAGEIERAVKDAREKRSSEDPLASIRCLLNKKKKLELIRIPEKDTRCRVAKGRRIDEGMPRHNHSVHRLMKKEISEE